MKAEIYINNTLIFQRKNEQLKAPKRRVNLYDSQQVPFKQLLHNNLRFLCYFIQAITQNVHTYINTVKPTLTP
jgi:hypothetical protein